MTQKIDLAKVAQNNGKFSISVESEIETKARIDREHKAAQTKTMRGNVELALLSITALLCLWFGVIDVADSQRVTWCRATFLAILSYIVGRQVGKGDASN